MRHTTLLLAVLLLSCRSGSPSHGEDPPASPPRAETAVLSATPRPPMVGGSGQAEANSFEMTPTPTAEPTVEDGATALRSVATPQPSATATQALTNAAGETPLRQRGEAAAIPGNAVAGATPAPAPSSNETQVRAAIQAIFPPSEWATAMRVAYCESRYDPTAVEPSGDHVGIFQVAPALHGTVPSDVYSQTVQAYGVYLKQGWGAWSCR